MASVTWGGHREGTLLPTHVSYARCTHRIMQRRFSLLTIPIHTSSLPLLLLPPFPPRSHSPSTGPFHGFSPGPTPGSAFKHAQGFSPDPYPDSVLIRYNVCCLHTESNMVLYGKPSLIQQRYDGWMPVWFFRSYNKQLTDLS